MPNSPGRRLRRIRAFHAQSITLPIDRDAGTKGEMTMKLRMLLLGVAIIAVSASVAVAAPQKGKPRPTGQGCKPEISVILKGTIAEAPGGAATLPFSLKVMGQAV